MKSLRAVSFLFLFILVSSFAFSDSRIYIGAGASYFRPSDENFKVAYGSSHILPDIEFGIRLLWHLHLIGGYSFLSKRGEVPELGIESKSEQQFLSFGAGFLVPIGKSASFLMAGGAASISYVEEVLDIKVDGNKIGFFGEAGLNILPINVLYIGFRAKYIRAKHLYEDVSFKLGGMKLNACIGVRF